MPRREFDDDEEWEQIDSNSQVDDYHIVRSHRSKRNEEPDHSEPATSKEHAADGQDPENSHDTSMALVKRTPSNSGSVLPHRSRPSHDEQDRRQLTTELIFRRSHSPNPTQQSQRSRTPVDFHTRGPRHEPSPRNTGHTYGAVYATGRSTVIMGNIGNVPEGARSHNYGPVFTADDAKVYFGDATTEEAAKAFQRRDERR